MQEFKHSSAVAQSAEFIQFAVDDVDQNLRFMDALTHSMKWVILQTFYQVCPHSGESYSKLWKWMSCWPHLDLQFRYIFCGVRLTHRDTKYWSPRLHWPYCIRYWVESVLPTSFLVSQKTSSTQGFTSRPVCCLSYATIYIDPGETLIFAMLLSTTVLCSSLCMIIPYGGSQLSSSRINQRQAICMALC